MQHLLPFLNTSMAILALVGTYMIIIAYDKTHVYDRVRRKGKVAEGTVVKIYQDPGPLFGKKPDSGFAPIVEFDFNYGNHKYASTTFQDPSPYKVGDKVKVWYYFYKSRREIALADDKPGESVNTLCKWGIILCILSYPLVFIRIFQLF